MSADLHPLRALLLTVSGWVNRHQQHVIEYLVEENRVLKEQLGGKTLLAWGTLSIPKTKSRPIDRVSSGY